MVVLCKGFSLIEVLIGLILVAMMLLGFDGISLMAMKKNQDLYLYELAENQMVSITERLIALDKLDNLAIAVNSWNLENQTLLPQAQGQVMGEFPRYELTLLWGEPGNFCVNQHTEHSGCLKQKIQLA